MNQFCLILVFLIISGTVVYVLQPEAETQVSSKTEERAMPAIAQDHPQPRPEREPVAVVVAADPAPRPRLEPISEVSEPVRRETWYTARRISVMTETGVSSVPAGVEVAKLGETEILYQGKRFTVKPGQLTTDAKVVAGITSKREAAEARVQADHDARAVAEQATLAAAQSRAEDEKTEREIQISSAVASIDRQIAALEKKIRDERNEEFISASRNSACGTGSCRSRISARGPVISRYEQAIAKLEEGRRRLLSTLP